MVTIRMARGGSKKRPFLELKQDRVEHWMKEGAQLSTRVNTLLKESAKAEAAA